MKLAAAARLETERERVVPFSRKKRTPRRSRRKETRDSLTDRTEDADEKERADRGPSRGAAVRKRRDATNGVSRNAFATLQSLPEEERLSTGALDARVAVDETRQFERLFRAASKPPSTLGVEPRARAPDAKTPT